MKAKEIILFELSLQQKNKKILCTEYLLKQFYRDL